MQLNLTIDCVELREDNSVDESRSVLLAHIRQTAVELANLVDGIIANQRLSDEEDQVGLVERDELGEGAHQRLVVLHASGRVNEHHVEAVAAGLVDGVLGNARGIAIVAARVQRNVEGLGVRAKLLNGAGAERVAGEGETSKIAEGMRSECREQIIPPICSHLIHLFSSLRLTMLRLRR